MKIVKTLLMAALLMPVIASGQERQESDSLLRMRTADGEIIPFQRNEAGNITVTHVYLINSHSNSADYSYGRAQGGGGREKGYRGFFEYNGGLAPDNGHYYNGYGGGADGRQGVATSHGYQFNPYFFIGIGLACNFHYYGHYNCEPAIQVPIFAHLRSDFLDKTSSPFGELRIGWSAPPFGDPYEEEFGFYFALSIGYRLGFGGRAGLNFSVGYEYQKLGDEIDHNSRYRHDYGSWGSNGIVARVGVDF